MDDTIYREQSLEIYNAALELQNFNDHSIDEAIEYLAIFTDVCWDLKEKEGLYHALKLGDSLFSPDISSLQRSLIYYFQANAWAGISTLTEEGTSAWKWEQKELENQIILLRRAIRESDFGSLSKVRKCQIYTNLGNCLNTVGRFIDALELWDKGLAIMPKFDMAAGNKGISLAFYARAHYDEGQAAYLIKNAHKNLRQALRGGMIEKGAGNYFEQELKWIEKHIDMDFLKEDKDLNQFSIGESDEEQEYRRWCLHNRLFLNPMNDLGVFTIAAADTLSTPPIAVQVGDGLYFQGFFNQMKQEYVSARYLFYEGLQSDEPHFSDGDVTLINTLDYPAYCLGVEKIRFGFRAAYSILDKISYFLNYYLDLQIPENKVGFRTIWYDAQNRTKGLKKIFVEADNWPLRGLYWLSKDLYENNEGFRDCLEPDAQEIHTIRNQLEHKYLKVHDDLWKGPMGKQERRNLVDILAFSLNREDFEDKTLRLFKMVRGALIYLSLAIHREEQRRMYYREKGKLVMPMPIDIIKDVWKR